MMTSRLSQHYHQAGYFDNEPSNIGMNSNLCKMFYFLGTYPGKYASSLIYFTVR